MQAGTEVQVQAEALAEGRGEGAAEGGDEAVDAAEGEEATEGRVVEEVEAAAQEAAVDSTEAAPATEAAPPRWDAAVASPPPLVLAEVLMASFAKQPSASHLVVGEVASDEAESEGARLLQLLVDLLMPEPTSPRRCTPSAALALYSAIMWGLLRRAALCSSPTEPAVCGLHECVQLLLERATARLARARASLSPSDPLLAMVPLVCSGLALLASFTSTFATRLLPALTPLCEQLADAAEGEDDAVARLERCDDFELSDEVERVESAHPYSASCEAQRVVRVGGASSCVWLQLDERCCTAEGDASLEIWSEGTLRHSFSGPSTQWPRHPLAVAGTCVTLKFHVHGGARIRDARACWGFACVARGFEPAVGTKVPVLLDCKKTVAGLGAKYAAVLIVGEPLSPEEHANGHALERMAPLDATDSQAWCVPGVSAALLPGLLEKRQRRAASRAAGLDAMLHLLRVVRLRTARKDVLLHLAGAFKALQRADGVSLFVHGCRGCDPALEARVRASLVQLLSLLASTLRSEVAHFAAGKGGDDSCLVAVAQTFLLRFREDDLTLLHAAGVLPMLRELQAARGRACRLCSHVLTHLVLCAFDRLSEADLTDLQADMLRLLETQLHAKLQVLAAPDERTTARLLELSIWRVESLLFTLCACGGVRAQVCASWLPPLAKLLHLGSERLAALTLRILRVALPAVPPTAAAVHDAFEASFGAVPLLALLLEAIGREACADAPLLALNHGRPHGDAASAQPLRTHGSPAGQVVNGLVSLVRSLHREGGEAWQLAVGAALSSALGCAHCVRRTSAADGGCRSIEAWRLLGALAVLGGHIDVVHDGGRAVQVADGHQPGCLVLASNQDTVLLYAETGETPLIQQAERQRTVAVADVEPTHVGLDSSALASTFALLRADPDDDEARGECTLIAMLQGHAVRAIHSLLSGEGGAAVAAALLSSQAFPVLLRMAETSIPRFELAAHLSYGPQVKAADDAALLADAALADAAPSSADMDGALRNAQRWMPDARLAVHLAPDLEEDEQVLALAAMGFPPHRCEEALRACGGDDHAALRLLANDDEADSDQQETIEKREKQLIELLVGMGFTAEHAELALRRTGYDLHRAADWLLEGGAETSSRSREPRGEGSTAAASAAIEEPSGTAIAVGETVEVSDSCGVWHTARVVASDSRAIRVHYAGWCAEWDEWLGAASHRLRTPTGAAANGPASLRCVPGDLQAKRVRASRAAGAAAAGESAADPSSGAGRSRWFWRQTQGASAKRRSAAAEKAAADVLCPSPEADFLCSDVGVTRWVPRDLDDERAEGRGTTTLQPGRRCRVRCGERAGSVGVFHEAGEAAAESRTVSVHLLEGQSVRSVRCTLEQLEPAEEILGISIPALAGRRLRTLFRAQCMLHRAAAVIHSRQVVLVLLCEMTWLHSAHGDAASKFHLSDLEPLLPTIAHVLKLVMSSPSAEGGGTDDLSMAWAATSNMLGDAALQLHAPSFAALPSLLANECVRFLARTATSVRQAESAHPSVSTEAVQMLCCPGVGMMQLRFDSRSQLSKSCRLSVYFDAACSREVASFDADDFLPAETLCVPGSGVWLYYRCEHNREHAWGYKLRAIPMQWRVRNELQLASMPYDNGWELLQLLVEVAPGELAKADLLPNLLRYLQHGRAPHKEKLATLLLKALPAFELHHVQFEWALFQTLEQQVAWHDHLVRQSQQVDSALLPCGSQCILDLLVEIREQLHASGIESWPSNLICMPEVEELSSLSKWLLRADESRLPLVWARLANSRQLQEVDPQAFVDWSLELDQQLVSYAEQVHAASGSLLTMRASHLATLAEQHRQPYPLLDAAAPASRCFRFALLQRFNQLLHKFLPLVHTGNRHEGDTLGGRICSLRGGIFMEVKQASLENALNTISTDSDAMAVNLNRFRTARAGQSPSTQAQNSLFVQLYEQIRSVKPRTLCRNDKAFRVNFVGEAADDHGGPYREAIAHICGELQTDVLPLFISSPNAVHGVGENRDAVVPNPSACAPLHLEWYFFVGQMLGLALRQRETQLNLTLPSMFWKQLVGQPMGADDLSGFDAMCRQSLDKLRFIEREGVDADLFSDIIFETFTTQLSDGSEVELVPNGSDTAVTFDNRLDFCRDVLHARLHESQRQCDAIVQGIVSVVPHRILSLFCWHQLELLMCGKNDIDLEALRSRTKYGIGVSPGQRHVRYFWNTLRRFNPEQRALFLRFVWGRSRLPATAAEWGDVKFTLHTRQSTSPDSTFPVAHTCFFSLELPAYTSAAACYEKLLYAITNCQAIDIDTTQSARDNRDAAIEETE